MLKNKVFEQAGGILCGLVFSLMDELDDIAVSRSGRIITGAFMESNMEYFHILEQ